MKPEARLHSVSATESEDNNDSEDANESRRSGIVLNRPDSVGSQMRGRSRIASESDLKILDSLRQQSERQRT